MRFVLKVLATLVGVLALCALGATAYLYLAPTFGAAGQGDSNPRLVASPQYQNGRFKNAVETTLSTQGQVDPDRSTIDFFFPPDGKRPAVPLPSVPLEAHELTNGRAAWLGHSTLLMRTGDRAVLIDPVFYDASPVPMTVHAFMLEHKPTIAELPPIDAVLISHDHYDHLDYRAVRELDAMVGQFLVPLGVGAHFARWGIDARKVVELDWYEHHDMGDVRFTLTPARHFSGRALTTRNTTLWGGWVIASADDRVYYSGDTGYFPGFAEIGERFGPFDIAFIENGAYDVTWADIHMTPEESVQASVELGAKAFFPVHWAKFDLAFHTWDEPILRAVAAADAQGVDVVTPLIGEIFLLKQGPVRRWWEGVRASESR
ncbi:MAG: MBL fold metallo-hydrolase [Pseudomonadota bacterium]